MAIELINNALLFFDYNESEIDAKLVDMIEKSQMYGAKRYVNTRYVNPSPRVSSLSGQDNSPLPGSLKNKASPGSRSKSKSPGSLKNKASPGSRRKSKSPGTRKNKTSPGSRRKSKSPGTRKNKASPGSRSKSKLPLSISNGINYFHLKLKEIFLTLITNPNIDLDDRQVVLNYLKKSFKPFMDNSSAPVDLFEKSANTIRMINDGLNKFEYSENDIDDELLEIIKATKTRLGATYAPPPLNPTPSSYFDRAVKYVFVMTYHKKGDDMPPADSKALSYLTKIFTKYNEGNIEYIEIVNATIKSMNGALRGKEFTPSDIDPVLLEEMIESQTHGADKLNI